MVTVDKDAPEWQALRLACAWARLIVRQAAAGSSGTPDLDEVRNLIAKAQQHLEQAATIRRHHATAARAITAGAAGLDDLERSITTILDRIEALPGYQTTFPPHWR